MFVLHYFSNLKLPIYENKNTNTYSLIKPIIYTHCKVNKCYICIKWNFKKNKKSKTQSTKDEELLNISGYYTNLLPILQTLNKGANINCVNAAGESILMEYIRTQNSQSNESQNRELLYYYVTNPLLNINYSMPNTGETALEYGFIYKLYSRNINMVELLLDNGANINGLVSLTSDRYKQEYVSEIMMIVLDLTMKQTFQLLQLNQWSPLIKDICLIITDYSIQPNLNNISELVLSKYDNSSRIF